MTCACRLQHHCTLPVAAQVPEDRLLADPPLLRLESEASHAYLSILLHVQTAQPELASSEVHSPRCWHFTLFCRLSVSMSMLDNPSQPASGGVAVSSSQ